jgi:hypothetical protein
LLPGVKDRATVGKETFRCLSWLESVQDRRLICTAASSEAVAVITVISMQLTKFSDYALRVLMYTHAAGDRRVTIEEIAAAYRISRAHLM